MKKAEDEPKKGAPAYMNTYGDLMTLLLTFFVLLFSMSSIDISKFRAFVASFEGASGILDGGEVILADIGMLGNGMQQFPAEGVITDAIGELAEGNVEVEELKEIKTAIESYLEENNLVDKIEVEQRGDMIVLRFDNVLLFDTGKAEIKAGSIPDLHLLGVKLKEYVEGNYKLAFEGHTDNVPIKTAQFPSNWELSAARAIAVAKFYIEEMGFEPSRVSAEGLGEYDPIADNATQEGRSMNRRVEIKLTSVSKSQEIKGGE